MEKILDGFGCGSSNRWQVFMDIFNNESLDDEALNWGFNLAYTTGRGINLDDVEKILPLLDLKLVSGEKGMELYNSLPEEVTLYRGTNMEECWSLAYGFSWTTDIKVARFFAFEYFATKDNGDRCVIQVNVKKRGY